MKSTGKPKKEHRSRILHKALLISDKLLKYYVDILEKVKVHLPVKDVEDGIEQVRRTTTQQMRIVVYKNIGLRSDPSRCRGRSCSKQMPTALARLMS